MAVRTRVKICGVTNLEDALRAARAGADAIGLIQVPGAKRYIHPDLAATIAAALPPMVTPVLVFADAEPGHILETAEHTGVRTIQLHGHETVTTALALHNLCVIKRLEVGLTLRAELEHWALLDRSQLAAVLLEGPGRAAASSHSLATPHEPPPRSHPAPTGFTGGTGVTGGTGILTDFDTVAWALESLEPSLLPPIVLAGGLNPDNVTPIVRRFRPFAVDTSSGVENPAVPLKKDPRRLESFFAAVTRANDPEP